MPLGQASAPDGDAPIRLKPLATQAKSLNSRVSIEARSGVFWGALLAVVLLFAVSDLALEALGYRYLGTGGPFFQKLHPSSYVVMAAFFAMLLRTGHPLDALMSQGRRWPGATVFLGFVLVLQAVILLKNYPLTYAIDTFLVPVLLFFVLAQLAPPEKRMLAYLVLAIFLANTALGFGEYATGEKLLSLEGGSDVAEKIADSLDWRPTAIFGHPLRNAFLTGLCVLILMTMTLPLRARLAFLALQLVAMLLFGGRSSMAIIAVLVVIMGAAGLVKLLLGRRFDIMAIPKALGGLVAAGAILFVLLSTGALDKVIERFEWDESAETRVSAIRMFEQFEPIDVLFGISQARKDALQVIYDTQFGIEIFWLAFLLDYGLIMLAAFTVAIAVFMRDIVAATSSRAGWLIAFFFLGISASLGISAKGVLLSQFVVMAMLFFDPQSNRDRNRPRSNATNHTP